MLLCEAKGNSEDGILVKRPTNIEPAHVPNNIRGLAAIDIAFLGYKLIFAEYAAGIVLALSLGIFVLFRNHSFLQAIWGIYLVCLGVNYIPMLIYTVAIGSKQNAHAELTNELAVSGKRRAMSKYRRVSLLLLIPLVVPVLAALQELSGANSVKRHRR